MPSVTNAPRPTRNVAAIPKRGAKPAANETKPSAPEAALPSFEGIKAFLAKHPNATRADLLNAMPRDLMSNFTLMKKSEARRGDCVTHEYPRVIAFMGYDKLKKTFLLSFNGNPKPGCQDIELIEATWGENRTSRSDPSPENPSRFGPGWGSGGDNSRLSGGVFTPRLVRVAPDGKIEKLVEHPNAEPGAVENEKCSRCHTADWRPIWQSYRFWPNAYGSLDDNLGYDESKFFDLRDNHWRKPRSLYSTLDWSGIHKPVTWSSLSDDYLNHPSETENGNKNFPFDPWPQGYFENRPNLRLTAVLIRGAVDRALRRLSRLSPAERIKVLKSLCAPYENEKELQRTHFTEFKAELDLSSQPGLRNYTPLPYFNDGAKSATLLFQEELGMDCDDVRRQERRITARKKMQKKDLVSERCTSSCHGGEREVILKSEKLGDYLTTGQMPMGGQRLTQKEIESILGESAKTKAAGSQ